MMPKKAVNKGERTVGTRYPADKIKLLDVVSERRGDPDRAATVRVALDKIIEEHIPGATTVAA